MDKILIIGKLRSGRTAELIKHAERLCTTYKHVIFVHAEENDDRLRSMIGDKENITLVYSNIDASSKIKEIVNRYGQDSVAIVADDVDFATEDCQDTVEHCMHIGMYVVSSILLSENQTYTDARTRAMRMFDYYYTDRTIITKVINPLLFSFETKSYNSRGTVLVGKSKEEVRRLMLKEALSTGLDVLYIKGREVEEDITTLVEYELSDYPEEYRPEVKIVKLDNYVEKEIEKYLESNKQISLVIDDYVSDEINSIDAVKFCVSASIDFIFDIPYGRLCYENIPEYVFNLLSQAKLTEDKEVNLYNQGVYRLSACD